MGSVVLLFLLVPASDKIIRFSFCVFVSSPSGMNREHSEPGCLSGELKGLHFRWTVDANEGTNNLKAIVSPSRRLMTSLVYDPLKIK